MIALVSVRQLKILFWWKYRALSWIDRALLRECRALFKCLAVV